MFTGTVAPRIADRNKYETRKICNKTFALGQAHFVHRSPKTAGNTPNTTELSVPIISITRQTIVVHSGLKFQIGRSVFGKVTFRVLRYSILAGTEIRGVSSSVVVDSENRP